MKTQNIAILFKLQFCVRKSLTEKNNFHLDKMNTNLFFFLFLVNEGLTAWGTCDATCGLDRKQEPVQLPLAQMEDQVVFEIRDPRGTATCTSEPSAADITVMPMFVRMERLRCRLAA